MVEPTRPTYANTEQSDRPPRGRGGEADEAEHPTAPPRRHGKDQVRRTYEYDLRHDLTLKEAVPGPSTDPERTRLLTRKDTMIG